MMPPRHSGFKPSQIIRFSGFRVNSLPSRVTIFSPSTARLTMIRLDSSFSRSNACMGWPISSITKLVISTTTLMLRSPQRAR